MSVSISKGRVRIDGALAQFIKSPFSSRYGSSKPKIIVMHYTYGASALSTAHGFANPKREKKASAHVTIDRDGTIIQSVSFDDCAWHAGESTWRDRHGKVLNGLNSHSFGIELANWGPLQKTGSGWKSYTGVPIADPVLAEHRNGNPSGGKGPIGWEPFPEAQISAAVLLARAIVAAYGADEIVGHDDISPVRKSDPGPAFDMRSFRTAVLGSGRDSDKGNFLTVAAPDGLNLREGPGQHFASVKLLPEGTVVSPLEREGRWLYVSVIVDGRAFQSGWVHDAYLA